MNAKAKDLWEKIKGFFLKMNKKVRLLLCGSVIAILVVAAIIAIWTTTRPYAVLITDMSSEEMQGVLAYLDENGVTQYRVTNGDTITVPASQENTLKAKLAMEGYPKSGFAYETYRSAVGAMSTESDRDIAYLQDLQDRMAAVIRRFDGVKDAVVNIVPLEDRRYILDSSAISSASASVFVTMDGGGTLNDQQANAIRNFIARSVQGLEINNISLSDSQGNTYASSSSTLGGSLDASVLKLQLQEEVNQSVRNKILEILTPLFGQKNFRVSVNSTVDVSHSVGETTSYTEPDWAADGTTGGRGIIGSQVYDREFIRDEDAPAGGVAGATPNADINNYMQDIGQVTGNEPYVRDSGTIQYNVNEEKEQIERWAGVVSDLMVSITINNEVAGDMGMNRDELINAIARASGIQPDVQNEKIALYLGGFYVETQPGLLPGANNLPFPLWMLYAAIGGLVLLLILLFFIFSLRRKKKKRLSAELSALLEDHNAPETPASEPTGVDIMTIKTEKSMELRKTIRQFAEENPEIAAYMLKSWLRGEEDAHG